jgi:hypothetical protein
LTSSSLSLPRERTSPRAAWRRSESASNTNQRLVGASVARMGYDIHLDVKFDPLTNIDLDAE